MRMLKVLLLLAGMVFFAVACVKVAVRDAAVYKAEVDFVAAASDEAVTNGKALLEASCACVDGRWTTDACGDMAETVVVLESRMGYHTKFMLFLGGVTKTRPPEDPPEIPESTSLCPATPATVPLRDGGPE